MPGPADGSRLWRAVMVAALVIVAVVMVTVATHRRSGSPVLCPGCNIVLITVDALRADHLGTYGYVRDTSPRIDALARESIVFERAIVAWPKTVPGLGSLLTGNYGHTIHMMYATFDPMLEESTMISEMLQQKGYATGGFTTNGNLSIKQGWNQGFDEYVELWNTPGRGRPDNVAEHGQAFVEKHKDQKFFLWLHYIDPHVPYIAQERNLRFKFLNDPHYKEIFYDKDRKRNIPLHRTPEYTWRTFGINGVPQFAIEQDKTEVAYYIAEYDAEITYTDKYIGTVVDYLKERGLWQRTIVVVTADHGEALGDHDWYFDHGRFAYDDSSRIPLTMYIPGVKPLRVAYPVSSNDITPTLLTLVGLEQPSPMDGQSLVPVIARKQERVAEYVFNEAGYNRDYQRTVRDGKWKLVFVPAPEARSVMQGGVFELYDMEKDPLETVNLVAEQPEVVTRLKGALFEWMKERMPPLAGYETIDGVSQAYTADYNFPNLAVEGNRFYAKIRGSRRPVGYCFTLAAPDPEARITIELLEASGLERPYLASNQKWDDPQLDKQCADDTWGCLRVNGERVGKLPHTVRLGDLGGRVDSTYVSLHGEGNDKSFCFQTGEFNKRTGRSELGYVVEVMGVVEEVDEGYKGLSKETRDNLRELGYVE